MLIDLNCEKGPVFGIKVLKFNEIFISVLLVYNLLKHTIVLFNFCLIINV